MLLTFGVSNHLSIRKYQQVSLMASKAIKDEAADLLEIAGTDDRALPAIVVYGANGSGKTNLLNSLDFLRQTILKSHTQGGPDSSIPVSPFLLDENSAEQPTKLDCDLVVDGVRLSFGVSLCKQRIHEEYLYAYPNNRQQKWYHRRGDEIEFGRSLSGKNKATFDLTRTNSLFLSAAANSNHEQLSKIYSYFQNTIVPYDEVPPFGQFNYKEFATDGESKTEVLKLLRDADISIVDISSAPKKESEKGKEFTTDFVALMEKHLGGRATEFAEQFTEANQVHQIRMMHKGDGDQNYPLPIDLESRGTRTFLNLLAPAIEALRNGQVLIIDELDTSLHSLLSKRLLSLFNRKESNPHGAQLLFTTHDTNLLSPTCVRRDQVWFTEKSPIGETEAFPLTDFKTRKTDDYEKGYLEGRFGAVPIIDEIASY